MIWILLIVWITIIIFYLYTRTYKKEQLQGLDPKEYPLQMLYTTGLFIYERLHFSRVARNEMEARKACNLLSAKGEGAQKFVLYVVKKLSICYCCLFVTVTLALLCEISSLATSGDVRVIQRPSGERGQEVELKVWVDGEREENITIEIDPKEEDKEVETKNETQEVYSDLYVQAYERIDEAILKGNQSLNLIGEEIELLSQITDLGVTIQWRIEPAGVIELDGSVQNEELNEPTLVWLYGTMYEDSENEIGEYQVNVTVIPKKDYEYAVWKNSFVQSIQEEMQFDTQEDCVVLPEAYEGKTLRWESIETKQTIPLVCLGAFISIAVYFVFNEELDTKMKKRKQQMLLDYPDIVNKLTLLIEAGMTVIGAWDRVVADYTKQEEQLGEKQKKKQGVHYAYEEMKTTNQELALGVSEAVALTEFGHRTGIVEYIKLSSSLVQNMKKGSEGLTQVLNAMAEEAFEERKQRAKRMGEEAGTKLLIPMMMMLMIVLVIIMIPAFWSMQI